MPKIKSVTKALSFFLIVSMLFIGCDIPDISKFTEASTEMTGAIRKGVKNTDELLESVSTNSLIENDLKEQFETQHVRFKKEFKPTLEALDALDSYLDALNNLSKAQKKSGENADATVNAFGSLVSAISGLTIPDTAIKLASGLLGLYEKARLEKDFKKRIDLVSKIVEGTPKPMTKNGATVYIYGCTDEDVDKIIDSADTPQQKATNLQGLGCGLIDYLKINVKFLKQTNSDFSNILTARLSEKNQVLISYRQNLQDNTELVRNERSYILRYKNLTAIFNEFQNTLNLQFEVKKAQIMNEYARKLANITDGNIRNSLTAERDKKILDAETAKNKEITKKVAEDKNLIQRILDYTISLDQSLLQLKQDLITFDNACNEAGNCNTPSVQDNRRILIINKLEPRYAALEVIQKNNENNLQGTDAEFAKISSALKQIGDKQTQLNSLLESSLSSLDAWKDTHINMRVALHTKKPLSASTLISRVREMWEILKPIVEK